MSSCCRVLDEDSGATGLYWGLCSQIVLYVKLMANKQESTRKICNNPDCVDRYGEKTHLRYDSSVLRCPRCGELLEQSPIADNQPEGCVARFYYKYFFLFWCLIGWCTASAIYLRPSVIRNHGFFLPLFVTLLVAAPLGFVFLFIAVVMRIILSMFVEGARNRDVEAFLGALYLLVLLISWIASMYSPGL